MLVKSKAIVLSKIKYNETSEIATLFTEEYGAVSFVVRIAKGNKSNIKNILFQPLNLLEVEWNHTEEQTTLAHVRNVHCFYPYTSLKYDPFKAAIASFLSEFLLYALHHEHANKSLFNYLVNSLEWLDIKQEGFSNFHIAFQMTVARFLGIFPDMDTYTENCVFDMQNACFLGTLPTHSYYISSQYSKSVYQILRMKIDNMHLYRFTSSQRIQVLELLNTYYRLHVPSFPVLKSIKILHDIFV